MPDILISAQDQKLLPEGLNLPYSARGGDLPKEPEPEPAIPPPVGNKKRGSKSLILAVLLFLLATLPLTVYFTSQQRELADLRGKAQEGVYGGTELCESKGGTCRSSWAVSSSCKKLGAQGCPGDEVCVAGCPAPPPITTISPPSPRCIPDGQCMTSSTACCGASHADTSCGYSIPIRCGSGPPLPGGTTPPGGTGTPPPGGGTPPPGGTTPPGGTGGPPSENGTPPPGEGTPPPGGTTPPGGSPTPTPTSTPTPIPGGTCELIKVYDSGGADITQAIAAGTKKLAIGEQVTIATTKGNATKARFRIQGIADWAQNDPSKTTATEYRLGIYIPSTLTQSQGTFEVEVFINGVWK